MWRMNNVSEGQAEGCSTQWFKEAVRTRLERRGERGREGESGGGGEIERYVEITAVYCIEIYTKIITL